MGVPGRLDDLGFLGERVGAGTGWVPAPPHVGVRVGGLLGRRVGVHAFRFDQVLAAMAVGHEGQPAAWAGLPDVRAVGMSLLPLLL